MLCVREWVRGQFLKPVSYWSEFIAVAVAVEGIYQVQIPPFCAAIGQMDRTDPLLIQQKA